jgi:hypothetical protein
MIVPRIELEVHTRYDRYCYDDCSLIWYFDRGLSTAKRRPSFWITKQRLVGAAGTADGGCDRGEIGHGRH